MRLSKKEKPFDFSNGFKTRVKSGFPLPQQAMKYCETPHSILTSRCSHLIYVKSQE